MLHKIDTYACIHVCIYTHKIDGLDRWVDECRSLQDIAYLKQKIGNRR